MSYVDLHLHLLPGVDDGAADDQAAVDFARRLMRAGVSEVAVTPHVSPAWNLDPLEIADRTARLAHVLRKAGAPIRLHAGAEIHPACVDDLSAGELDAVALGPAGSRWVLLEAPFAGIDEEFVASVELLRNRGYGALIGHPERAVGFLDSGLKLLRPLLTDGAVLQVSVDSLAGTQGPAAQEGALRLLRAGLGFVLASDGHPGTREQTLAEGARLALRAGISGVQVWRLTQTNPSFLLRSGLPRVPLLAPLQATS